MKKKIILFAAAVMAMASCIGYGNSLPDDGIYGEIPGIIQKTKNEMEAELQKKLGIKDNDFDKALKNLSTSEAIVLMIAISTEQKEKIKKATADAFESMKGKELPYVMGDSVPYTIDNGVTITEMQYNNYITVTAAMDVTMQQEMTVSSVYFYFLVENDTTALIQDYKSIRINEDMGFKVKHIKDDWFSYDNYVIKKGDKLHVDFTFSSGDCTPDLMASCKRLKFVTEKEYLLNSASRTVKRILKEREEKKEKKEKSKE